MLKRIRIIHIALFFLALTVVFVVASNLTDETNTGLQLRLYYMAAGAGMISALFFLIYTLRR